MADKNLRSSGTPSSPGKWSWPPDGVDLLIFLAWIALGPLLPYLSDLLLHTQSIPWYLLLTPFPVAAYYDFYLTFYIILFVVAILLNFLLRNRDTIWGFLALFLVIYFFIVPIWGALLWGISTSSPNPGILTCVVVLNYRRRFVKRTHLAGNPLRYSSRRKARILRKIPFAVIRECESLASFPERLNAYLWGLVSSCQLTIIQACLLMEKYTFGNFVLSEACPVPDPGAGACGADEQRKEGS